MAVKSLAVKYRPQSFDEVVEQGSIKIILENQLAHNETKNAYLFCGGAGTGKTTCARIFANEINHHQGAPIEMDAASNSSVDDVREIIQQAKTKSLTSEYKVFIIDECHSLSNTAWQALLKLLEEPPAKSIFIFCTTDPQKIPKTILSRVQRYDFQRISQRGIVSRLFSILDDEGYNDCDKVVPLEPLEYIAKIADGGMRDALTLLDKCLAFSSDLSIKSVVFALGLVDYEEMFNLLSCITGRDNAGMIERIEAIHMSGKDLKQFMKQFTTFVLDVCKYKISNSFQYIQIPSTYEDQLDYYKNIPLSSLLSTLTRLNSDIKWETSPKSTIEAALLLESLNG